MNQQDGEFEFAAPRAPAASDTNTPPQNIPVILDPLVARLNADAWDPAAWTDLLQRLRHVPVADARVHYERFFKLYPTAANYWQQYAEHEQQSGESAKAEAILQRCVLSCLDPNLWLYYVNLVVSTKLVPAQDRAAAGGAGSEEHAAEGIAAARRDVLQAYEFALTHVGAAFGSGPLWEGFVRFLASAPEGNAYETSAKRDALRRGYHRAVAAPHAAAEALWTEYSEWETANAPSALATALLANHTTAAGTARAVYAERRALWGGMYTAGSLLATPPPPGGGRASADRLAAQARLDDQAARWRRVLAYELSNPLRLDREDHAGVVRLHFKQATALLRWHADAWYDYMCFEREFAPAAVAAAAAAPADAAFAVLRTALDVLPSSVVLTVAAAEHCESHPRKLLSESNALYEELIRCLSKIAVAGAPAIAAAAAAASPPASSSSGAPPLLPLPPHQQSSADPRFAGQAAAPSPSASDAAAAAAADSPAQLPLVDALLLGAAASSATLAHLDAKEATDAAATVPLAFILHQRFARRTRGVAGARAVFAAARKSEFVSPAVYLANAQLEFYANFGHGAGREAEEFRGVARNALEAGRKRFPRDVHYALSALDALVTWENATNVRAFFEAALEGLPPSDTRPVWDRYIDYELKRAPGGGSLGAVSALEARRASMHPHLVTPDARGLARLLPHAMAFDATPACSPDADLIRRHPFSPFSLLFAPSQPPPGSAPSAYAPPPPPSYADSPAKLVARTLNDPQLNARTPRDGLYPQIAPAASSPLSHVPPSHWIPALGPLTAAAVDAARAAASAASASAEGREAAAAAAAAAAAQAARIEALQAQVAELRAAGAAAAASAADANATAAAAVAAAAAAAAASAGGGGGGASVPQYTGTPSPSIRRLLTRLPAFDDSMGDGSSSGGGVLPPVDELLRRLSTILLMGDAAAAAVAAAGGDASGLLGTGPAMEGSAHPLWLTMANAASASAALAASQQAASAATGGMGGLGPFGQTGVLPPQQLQMQQLGGAPASSAAGRKRQYDPGVSSASNRMDDRGGGGGAGRGGGVPYKSKQRVDGGGGAGAAAITVDAFGRPIVMQQQLQQHAGGAGGRGPLPDQGAVFARNAPHAGPPMRGPKAYGGGERG